MPSRAGSGFTFNAINGIVNFVSTFPGWAACTRLPNATSDIGHDRSLGSGQLTALAARSFWRFSLTHSSMHETDNVAVVPQLSGGGMLFSCIMLGILGSTFFDDENAGGCGCDGVDVGSVWLESAAWTYRCPCMFAFDDTHSTDVTTYCGAVEIYGKDAVVAAGYAMMGSMYAIIDSLTSRSHIHAHMPTPLLTPSTWAKSPFSRSHAPQHDHSLSLCEDTFLCLISLTVGDRWLGFFAEKFSRWGSF